MERTLTVTLGPFLVLFAAAASVGHSASFTLDQVSGRADASSSFFGTSFPSASDSASFGPFGGVAVAQVGQNRAVQTGSGFNAVNAQGRFGDIPSFIVNAETDIDQVVRNTGSTADNLTFHYTINGGELRLFGSGGSFNDLEAMVAVSIFVISPSFGGFLWDWGVTLRGAGSSATSQVHGFASIFPLNDPLGLGTPAISAVTISGNDAVLSIAPFHAVVDLGSVTPDSTALVTYTMRAEVSGPGFNVTGGKASLGDPFDIDSNPGSQISFSSGSAAVPEPAAGILTAIGLAGVRLLRMRRNQRATHRD